jgi:hypothetical protein
MKIKVGNKIYDAEKEPVMVILSDKDKENIINMDPTATKYCGYPDDYDGDIRKFMKTDEN